MFRRGTTQELDRMAAPADQQHEVYATPLEQQADSERADAYAIEAYLEDRERYNRQKPDVLFGNNRGAVTLEHVTQLIGDGGVRLEHVAAACLQRDPSNPPSTDKVVRVIELLENVAINRATLKETIDWVLSGNELKTPHLKALGEINRSISNPGERDELCRIAWSGITHGLATADTTVTEKLVQVMDTISVLDTNAPRRVLKLSIHALTDLDKGKIPLPYDMQKLKVLNEDLRTHGATLKVSDEDLALHAEVVAQTVKRYSSLLAEGKQDAATHYKVLIETMGFEIEDGGGQAATKRDVLPLQSRLAPTLPSSRPKPVQLSEENFRIILDEEGNRFSGKVFMKAALVGAAVVSQAVAAAPANAATLPATVQSVAGQPAAPAQVLEVLPEASHIVDAVQPANEQQVLAVSMTPAGQPTSSVEAATAPQEIPQTAADPSTHQVKLKIAPAAEDQAPVIVDTVNTVQKDQAEVQAFTLFNGSGQEAFDNMTKKIVEEYQLEAVDRPEFQNKLADMIKEMDTEVANRQLTESQRMDYRMATIYAQLIAKYPTFLSYGSVDDSLHHDEKFISVISQAWLDSADVFGGSDSADYTPQQKAAIEKLIASAMATYMTPTERQDLVSRFDPSVQLEPAAVPTPAPSATPKHKKDTKLAKPHHDHPKHHAQPHAQPNHHENSNTAPNKYNTGNYKQLWDYFLNDKDLNLSEVGVAALLGNFATETGGTMNPRIIQGFSFSLDLPSGILGKAGYGLNQATSRDRQLHMKAVAHRMGLPEGTLAVQQQYIKEELLNYPGLLDLLRKDNADLLKHDAIQVEVQYERAGVNAWSSRIQYAQRIYAANATHPQKVTVVPHDTGNTQGVPNDPTDRIGYFANETGVNKGDIKLTKSYAGIFHYMIDPSAAADKLNIHDIYPDSLKNLAKDAVPDKYGMFNRECVSYVAYRVGTDKFDSVVPHWGGRDNLPDVPGIQSGNAKDWDQNAKAAGIRVDNKPAVGSVIQWNTNGAEHATAGHVAYVEKVYDDGSLIISQYNAGGTGDYSVEEISPQLLQLQKDQVNFLHFEDWNN